MSQFKGRREDLRLVTGQGKYASDWNLPNQLYGFFLRSDRAHAEIASIDAGPALRSPGVAAVFTGADAAKAGFRTAPQLVKYPGRGGMKILVPHRDMLATDRVRFVGQEVALVVASTALAAQDAAADRYDLYTSSQGMSLILGGLSGITGIPAEKFRVHAQDVGGGFGIRSDTYAEYVAAILAAKTLGRPVKWVSSRSETFQSDYHGRAAKLIGELALDRDGNFLAIRIQWIVNAGAYLSTPGPLINTLPPSLHAVNLYRIPVVYGRHRLALTNTTPTTAYRGAGRPNVCYLAERLVEEAARETGIDRIELRRRNLIPKDAFPYQTPIAISTYDSGDPPGLLEEAVKRAEWSTFEARRAESTRTGKLRGI